MKPAHAKVGGTSKQEREGSAHVSATRKRTMNERSMPERSMNERGVHERGVNERALDKRALGERGVGERLQESKLSFGQRGERDSRRPDASASSGRGATGSGIKSQRGSREGTERPNEEPRTGVVRKVKLAAALPALSGAAPRRAAQKTAPPSGQVKSSDDTGVWRCLEWGERPSQRPPKRNANVSVAQLSTNGQVIRQDGPEDWLPEAGDFVHRMALLVAQGLGFDRCRAVCLRGPSAVLSVSEAGPTKVVAVTGPVLPMSNLLRRVGLE